MLLELGRYEEAASLSMKTLKKDEVNVAAMQVLGWSFVSARRWVCVCWCSVMP